MELLRLSVSNMINQIKNLVNARGGNKRVSSEVANVKVVEVVALVSHSQYMFNIPMAR